MGKFGVTLQVCAVLSLVLAHGHRCDGQSFGSNELHLSTEKKTPCEQSGEALAFHVLYQGPQLNYTENIRILPYNVIKLNEGNGFNPTTHRFTALRSGLYMFIATGLSGKPGKAHIRLYKNDAPLSQSWGGGIHRAMAASAITRLNAGDTVGVFLVLTGAGAVSNIHGDNYQSFMGYLISQ